MCCSVMQCVAVCCSVLQLNSLLFATSQVCGCMYVLRMYLCIYVSVYPRMFVCSICVCVCVFVCMYMHVYTYILCVRTVCQYSVYTQYRTDFKKILQVVWTEYVQ